MKGQRTFQKAALQNTIKEANEVFRLCSRRLKILSAISWGREVAQEFFRKKEAVLPSPKYNIDKSMLKGLIESLEALGPRIKGEHPVHKWLERTRESYLLGARLLLSIETDKFYEISSQLYGNSKSVLGKGQVSNLKLAETLSARMATSIVGDIAESDPLKESSEFAGELERRLRHRKPAIPVKIDFVDDISAKVVAGMGRVRIRRDARFSALEVSALWNHEIESHCLTANNGSLQENCDFLMSGGPRTTMTQEGLAVFFELYGHSLSQRRFIALCERIQAVHLAEDGANFIDLYRWFRERSENEMEAFLSTSRVFRGSKLEGRVPFTKDVVYLAGLLAVYTFLRVAVKNQNRLLVETLVCGRMALEDVGTLAWLRSHGILSPPKFVPSWLENWEALLSSFSFSALLGTLDLTTYQDYFEINKQLQDWHFSL